MTNHSHTITAFKQYLERSGFTWQTQKSYRCIVDKFLTRHPQAATFGYKDILGYLENISRSTIKPSTKGGKLIAIKKYFDYLIEEGIREDHPCKTLNIKGNQKRGVIFTDLFTMSELESLLEREERYAHLKVKNQVVISLLIYQGLLPGEIINIKLHHIDLDAGTIYVKGGDYQLTSRKLELHPRQYRLFDNYAHDARKRLLYKEADNNYFLLNYQGSNYTTSDSIIYLIETLKPRFPDRNLNTSSIRDSVIANWLNEKQIPLEQVQLMAGHRWISSTLRYRQAPVAEQREILNKFYPLG